MCLDLIEKEGLSRKGFGYKVFTKRNGALQSWIRTLAKENYKPGVWYKAKNIRRDYYDKLKYQPGFHIFLTRRNVKNYLGYLYEGDVILRVQYKNGHTEGAELQYTCSKKMRVVVADYIKILPGQKGI